MALDALTSQTTRIYTGVVCGLKQSREREALLMEDGPEREAFVEETNRLFFKMTGNLAEMHFKRFGLFFVATDKQAEDARLHVASCGRACGWRAHACRRRPSVDR